MIRNGEGDASHDCYAHRRAKLRNCVEDCSGQCMCLFRKDIGDHKIGHREKH